MAAAAADAGRGGFERLTEDEVTFCWRSLADQGQLSAQRLQQFFLEVCGEPITLVQAKDLLNYMDANGDGRVGMEDFRNFASIGSLADTDPKSFMWTPKAKYREEHGLHHQEEHQQQQRRSCLSRDTSQPLAIGTSPSNFDFSRRFSLESLAESLQEEPQPHIGRGGHLETVGELGSVDELRSTRVLPHNQHDLHSQTPSPVPPSQASRGSRFTGNRGRRASQLAHNRPSVVSVDSPGPGARESSRTRPGSVVGRPSSILYLSEQPDLAPRPTITTTLEAPPVEPEARRERPPKAPTAPRVLQKIEQALEKYEQAEWALLMREEKDAQRRIFAQFAAEQDAMELSAGEFHKMLVRWQELARWQLPGDLRPGDSLAALEYFTRRDRERRGPPQPPEGAEATEAPLTEASQATAAEHEEARLTYQIWLDIVAGKHRPEEHIGAS